MADVSAEDKTNREKNALSALHNYFLTLALNDEFRETFLGDTPKIDIQKVIKERGTTYELCLVNKDLGLFTEFLARKNIFVIDEAFDVGDDLIFYNSVRVEIGSQFYKLIKQKNEQKKTEEENIKKKNFSDFFEQHKREFLGESPAIDIKFINLPFPNDRSGLDKLKLIIEKKEKKGVIQPIKSSENKKLVFEEDEEEDYNQALKRERESIGRSLQRLKEKEKEKLKKLLQDFGNDMLFPSLEKCIDLLDKLIDEHEDRKSVV